MRRRKPTKYNSQLQMAKLPSTGKKLVGSKHLSRATTLREKPISPMLIQSTPPLPPQPQQLRYVDKLRESINRLKMGSRLQMEVQTERIELDLEEQEKLERKLREREEYVRKNTTKVLHWLFQYANHDLPEKLKKTEDEDDDDEEEDEDDLDHDLSPGLQALLSPKEIGMLPSPEWRLVVHQMQFTIVSNKNKGNSFYRTLAQAVTGKEDGADAIRKQLCLHVTGPNWGKYESHLRQQYQNQTKCPISTYATSREVARFYKHEQLKEKKPGSYFQLKAAAEFFNFNFILIFKRHHTVKCVNFVQQTRAANIYVFFVWPIHMSNPFWRLLTPLDIPVVKDGEYPLLIKRTFLAQQCCTPTKTSEDEIDAYEDNEFPNAEFAYKIVTLQAGKEEFEYPIQNLRLPQDLYSLLSHVFFGNSFHADEIQAEILEHRSRFQYFINLNPKRKSASNRSRFATHYRQDWGDVVDLKIAASIYKFCYTVIAMDRLGNLSQTLECRDRSHVHTSKLPGVNYLAFFTRVTPRTLAWFKLELFDPGEIHQPINTYDSLMTSNVTGKELTLISRSMHGPSTVINALSLFPYFSKSVKSRAKTNNDNPESAINITKAPA